MKTGYLLTILILSVTGFGVAMDHLFATPVNVTPLINVDGQRPGLGSLDKNPKAEQISLDDIEFSSTLTRPLFNRDRRKFVKPPPAPVKKPPVIQVATQAKPVRAAPPLQPDPVFTLLGISISEGKSSALLSQNGGENKWVSSGDKINAWNIEDIGENHVRLSHGTREINLLLYDDGEQ